MMLLPGYTRYVVEQTVLSHWDAELVENVLDDMATSIAVKIRDRNLTLETLTPSIQFDRGEWVLSLIAACTKRE